MTMNLSEAPDLLTTQDVRILLGFMKDSQAQHFIRTHKDELIIYKFNKAKRVSKESLIKLLEGLKC